MRSGHQVPIAHGNRPRRTHDGAEIPNGAPEQVRVVQGISMQIPVVLDRRVEFTANQIDKPPDIGVLPACGAG